MSQEPPASGSTPDPDERPAVTHGTFDDALALRSSPFQLTPRHWRGRAYGMEYIRLDEPDGGRLWVTRLGWPKLAHLLPERWHTGKLYAQTGERLKNATATVFRVPTDPANTPEGRPHAPLDLIVKFARFATDVPIWVTTGYDDKESIELHGDPRFNSPFEEFGRTSELRRCRYGLGGATVYTHRPLAIYSPSGKRPLWQLGRSKSKFRPYTRDLKNNLPGRMLEDDPTFFELDLQREYVTIYEWLKGIDCEAAFEAGLVSEAEMHALTERVTADLATNGFLVLDNKPRHYILRRRKRDGSLIRRGPDGDLAYGLIDFELLQKIGQKAGHTRAPTHPRG